MATVDIERSAPCSRLRRPLDGIVLALDVLRPPPRPRRYLRTLEQVAQVLRYQPPVYLWQLHDSDWPQDTRITRRWWPSRRGPSLNGSFAPFYRHAGAGDPAVVR